MDNAGLFLEGKGKSFGVGCNYWDAPLQKFFGFCNIVDINVRLSRLFSQNNEEKLDVCVFDIIVKIKNLNIINKSLLNLTII